MSYGGRAGVHVPAVPVCARVAAAGQTWGRPVINHTALPLLAAGPPPRYTNPAELASGYSPGAGHASGLSRSFDEGELHQHSPQHPHQGEPGAVTPGAAAAAAQGLFGSTPQREAEQRSPQPRGSPWVPPGMVSLKR